MKALVRRAVRLIEDRDGFLNGFFRGVAGTAMLMSMLAMFTGCFG